MSNNFCLHSKKMREFTNKHFSNIRAPFTAGIELTTKCNMRCLHCYEQNTKVKSEMSTEQIKKIIDILVDKGLLELFFTGGEVFVHPDFEDIYVYAKKKGLMISVLSNVTLLEQKHVNLFLEYPITLLSTTAYGCSEKTYELVTKTKGSYGKFIKAIDLVTKNQIPLEIKFVAMEQNVEDLYKISDFCRSIGADSFVCFDIRATSDGDIVPINYRLTPQKAFEYDLLDPDRRKFWEKVARENVLGKEENKISFSGKRYKEGYLYPCSIAQQFVFVTSEGKMQGCTKASYNQYDLLNGNFDEGWTYLKKQFVDVKASKKFKCINCDKQKYCEQCTANFVLEYGNAEAVDYFFCEVASMRKNFIENEMKKYKE